MILKRNKKYSRELIICLIEWAFPEIDNKDKVYIGITNDPQTRMHAHGVDENDAFLILEAKDRDTAKDVEKYLLDNHQDTLGNTGGGTDDTVFVYAFEWINGKHRK